MGGEGADGHGDFRNKVWSMTGGSYCGRKRKAAIAMFVIVLVCIPIFILSTKLEVTSPKLRPQVGESFKPPNEARRVLKQSPCKMFCSETCFRQGCIGYCDIHGKCKCCIP